jgi:glycolate oxidase FAD binding subunit
MMSEFRSAFLPDTQEDLVRYMAENAATGRQRLRAIGGDPVLGEMPIGDLTQIRLDKLNRVIDYPARDMTITVEAGIRMAELTRILKAENQRLPIDVPQAEQATLGGVIAANWSGSRRFGCGTMRDYVIGVRMASAAGASITSSAFPRSTLRDAASVRAAESSRTSLDTTCASCWLARVGRWRLSHK